MKLALAVLALPAVAAAEPTWRVDLPLRAIGSLELDAAAPQQRPGIVPALAMRVQRRIARGIYAGTTLGAGFPAWYGRAEAASSLDLEHVLAEPRCALHFDGPQDVGTRACHGPRLAIGAGLDAGLGIYYFDAPPMLPASSDALLYWGPLARARVQLHVLDLRPRSRAIGIVIGASLALTSARFMSTADGSGVRLEPELEMGLTTRL